MAMEEILATDIVVHSLQSICIVSSSILLFLSKKAGLMKNQALLLIHILVLSDLLHAALTLPYTVYLTSKWNSSSITLNPRYVIISSVPLPFQLKFNLVIISAVAIDRLLALFVPAIYRTKNHKKCAITVSLIGILLGSVDVGLEMLVTDFSEKPNCTAIGCTIGDGFRYYWGTSNAIMGFFVMLLIVIMMIKLKVLAKKSVLNTNDRDQKRFSKSNRSAMISLFSSFFFITIPSIFAGVFEMTGTSIFRILGPFYIVGLLAAGSVHSISQLTLNKELRSKFAKVFGFTPATIVSVGGTASRWISGQKSSSQAPPANQQKTTVHR